MLLRFILVLICWAERAGKNSQTNSFKRKRNEAVRHNVKETVRRPDYTIPNSTEWNGIHIPLHVCNSKRNMIRWIIDSVQRILCQFSHHDIYFCFLSPASTAYTVYPFRKLNLATILHIHIRTVRGNGVRCSLWATTLYVRCVIHRSVFSWKFRTVFPTVCLSLFLLKLRFSLNGVRSADCTQISTPYRKSTYYIYIEIQDPQTILHMNRRSDMIASEYFERKYVVFVFFSYFDVASHFAYVF